MLLKSTSCVLDQGINYVRGVSQEAQGSDNQTTSFPGSLMLSPSGPLSPGGREDERSWERC